MIFSKIWERHILIEILKFCFFFLFCIYMIYVIIDFSTHSARIFTYSKVEIFDIFLYYLNHFIMRFNLFLSLALIFSVIKVLSDMNIHNELTALQMAGISCNKLTRPFFFVSIVFCLFSYANQEYFLTKSLNYIDHFKINHLRRPGSKKEPSINTIALKDNSKLIYQSINTKTNELFDTFWIKSTNEIWHIKYLAFDQNKSCARYCDQFIKNDKNQFIKEKSYEKIYLDDLSFNKKIKKKMSVPLENRSISDLFISRINKRYSSEKEKVALITYLNYNLAMPLLPILIVLALSPFCIRFSRKKISIFFICSLSLISFVFFYTTMDAMVILGENRVFFGGFITWLPMILCFIIFGRRFVNFSKIN
jgi:lipopolysaccharide export system permease protein